MRYGLTRTPNPEDLPVTFQVGMVGTDGVLIASDQLSTYTDTRDGSPRATMLAPKILRSEKLACCASGFDVASHAAELCVHVPDCANASMHMMDCATESRNEIGKGCGDDDASIGGTLLMAHLKASTVELLSLDLKWPLRPPCPQYGHVWLGDRSNQAVFYLEHYVRHQNHLPIADLCFVAAHTVLTAGRLSHNVRGLEIVLCRPSGFEVISQARIAELTDKSRELDSEIRARLGF